MRESIRKRKNEHLDICLDTSLEIETGDTGLKDIGFHHRSLPETRIEGIDLTTDFLGYRLKLPIMISCMTGGSKKGRHFNEILADAAQEEEIAIGTGSIRVMIEHPETCSDFQLKHRAPDSPVIANIGAAQLSEYKPDIILDAVNSIAADGLYVHLNAAQEFFQTGGDKTFTGWKDGISRLLEAADRRTIPILIKETGSGIPPVEGLFLLEAGISYLDIAAAGGTDWIAVEALRSDGWKKTAAHSFTGWGYSTGELLLAYRQIARAGGESGRRIKDRLIASGGIRTPRDFAVSLACGAYLAAAALPFARNAASGGSKAVSDYIKSIAEGIKAAAALSGASNLEEFRCSELRILQTAADTAEELAEEALTAREDSL